MAKQKLELNKEYPTPDEDKLATELADLLQFLVGRDYLSGQTLRDVHAKGIALIKGEFEVNKDLPPELQVGVFQPGKKYPCWIRVSNSNAQRRSDSLADIRGFAIKLMGVPGKKLIPQQENADTQDFLFLSTPKFLTRTARGFFEFMKGTSFSLGKRIGYVLTHPIISINFLRALKKFANPVDIEWFSSTPYRFGDRAAKYHLMPTTPKDQIVKVSTKSKNPQAKNNHLRLALEEQFKKGPVSFDFEIQFQEDPYKQPIEDGFAVWNTPFTKIATLTLPPQDFTTPLMTDYRQNISFNPWHCIEEHRPLGNINRVRLKVYFQIASFRRARNNVPNVEPTPESDLDKLNFKT